MTQHTQGPWMIDGEDHGYVYIHGDNLIDGKSGIVARVLLTGNDFNRGNAALIAAAPDLLKELKDMYAFIVDRDYASEDSDGMRDAAAAIAKAEGR